MDECGTGSHAHDNSLFGVRKCEPATGGSGEFFYSDSRNTVDIAVNIGSTYAGNENLFDIMQRKAVCIGIIAERTVKRGELIVCANHHC